jgi:hypothetical protein
MSEAIRTVGFDLYAGAAARWRRMSGAGDRKKQERLHPAVLNAKLDAELRRDPRDWEAMARWLLWHPSYFETSTMPADLCREPGNRACPSQHLEESMPQQAPDGQLGTMIGLKKGKTVSKLILKAGDIEGAERLAKRTGLPLKDCIEAYSRVNLLNSPSYMGGDLIQKGVGKSKKAKKLAKRYARRVSPPPPATAPSAAAALNSLALAAVDHTQAKRGNGVDPAVTKAQLDRATTQCQLEMVKAARSRPLALGDLGVIAMLRHGRP